MGEEEWGASDACEGPGENDCLNALGLGSQRHGLNRVDDGQEAVKAHQNQSVDADMGQVWLLTQFFCGNFFTDKDVWGIFYKSSYHACSKSLSRVLECEESREYQQNKIAFLARPDIG